MSLIPSPVINTSNDNAINNNGEDEADVEERLKKVCCNSFRLWGEKRRGIQKNYFNDGVCGAILKILPGYV